MTIISQLQGQGKHLQIVSLRPKGGEELGIKAIVRCLYPANVLLMDEIHWVERLEQVPLAFPPILSKGRQGLKTSIQFRVLGNSTGTLITENDLGFSNSPKS